MGRLIHAMPYQPINFGLSFVYDVPEIWNDLPDDVLFQKQVETYFPDLSLCLWSYDYGFLLFCIILESVFRWRLSTIKVLLELELEYQLI